MTTTTLIYGPNVVSASSHVLWSNPTNWTNGLPTNGEDITLSVTGTDDLAGVTSLGTVTIGRGISSETVNVPLSIDTMIWNSEGFILDQSTLSIGHPAPSVGYVVASGGSLALGSLSALADVYTTSTLYVQGTVGDGATLGIYQGSTLELGTATGQINAAVTYSDGATVMELAASRLIGAAYYFGSTTELTLTTDAGTLTLANFTDDTTSSLPTAIRSTIDPVTNLLKMTFVSASGNGITPIQTSASPPPPTPPPATGPGTGTTGTGTPACYVRGTMIAVADGERPIETLRAGDLVRTAAGGLRPVRWLARRCYSAGDLAAMDGDPRPVRVRADALAPGVPSRDLVVSPEHALLLDGVLVPASALVNAMSILREPAGGVDYLHVELDSHDALLACGAASESFSDCDNVHQFDNVAQRMHVAVPPWNFCAPRLAPGAVSEAMRLRLARRAAPDGPVLACGDRLVAGRASGRVTWRFDLDGDSDGGDVATLRLLSPSLVPALLGLGADQRRLGVPVRAVAFDAPGGRWAMPLDAGELAAGWHVFETTHRWTNGDALLPTGGRRGAGRARELEVTLADGAEMAWQAAIG